MEVTEAKKQGKKKKKRRRRNEDRLRDLWDNIKHSNICIIGVPEEERRKKGVENIFENIIVEISNLGKRNRHPGPGCIASPK